MWFCHFEATFLDDILEQGDLGGGEMERMSDKLVSILIITYKLFYSIR